MSLGFSSSHPFVKAVEIDVRDGSNISREGNANWFP